MNLIEKVFGTHSERELKMIRPIVTKIESDVYKRQLKSHGLDVPQVTELAWELKEAGMPLTDGILSREELVEQLVPLLR